MASRIANASAAPPFCAASNSVRSGWAKRALDKLLQLGELWRAQDEMAVDEPSRRYIILMVFWRRRFVLRSRPMAQPRRGMPRIDADPRHQILEPTHELLSAQPPALHGRRHDRGTSARNPDRPHIRWRSPSQATSRIPGGPREGHCASRSRGADQDISSSAWQAIGATACRTRMYNCHTRRYVPLHRWVPPCARWHTSDQASWHQVPSRGGQEEPVREKGALRACRLYRFLPSYSPTRQHTRRPRPE